MALKTDYKDDVFSGNRKYQKTDNSDGTISLVDKTAYSQKGDTFSAADINETNKAINGLSAVATTSSAGLMSANDKSKLDNLQVGGRNLLLNSGIEITNNNYNIASYYVSPSEGEVLSNGYGCLVANKQYTLTICVTPGENVGNIKVFISSGNIQLSDFAVTENKKQVLSTKIMFDHYATGMEPSVDPVNAAVKIFRPGVKPGTTYGNTTIHWVKIESGTMPTDWTPAPEDTDNAINALNSTTKSFTLSASSWSSGSYTISDSMITTSSNQEILPAVGITTGQMKALQKATIVDAGQTSGSLTIKALGTVPMIDIPIRVIFRGTI